MNFGRAFLAGVIGGAAMSVGLAMGRAMGMPANLEMMLGTMTGSQPGATAWAAGFVAHIVISGLIALIYAVGFEYVTHRAGWLVGAGFGFIHAIIGGLFMGVMPMMHPLIPGRMPAPGAFMSNMGAMGVVAEFTLHLIYGAVVGAMYTPVRGRLGARVEA